MKFSFLFAVKHSLQLRAMDDSRLLAALWTLIMKIG